MVIDCSFSLLGSVPLSDDHTLSLLLLTACIFPVWAMMSSTVCKHSRTCLLMSTWMCFCWVCTCGTCRLGSGMAGSPARRVFSFGGCCPVALQSGCVVCISGQPQTKVPVAPCPYQHLGCQSLHSNRVILPLKESKVKMWMELQFPHSILL